jgi:hypothetical protein
LVAWKELCDYVDKIAAESAEEFSLVEALLSARFEPLNTYRNISFIYRLFIFNFKCRKNISLFRSSIGHHFFAKKLNKIL